MAWYPVYRIPDAPLTAKFLTYHSLAPVACSATHYGALCPLPARPAPSWQASGPLCLPAIGLRCISLGCGSWLDAVPGLHGELPMSLLHVSVKQFWRAMQGVDSFSVLWSACFEHA